MKYDRDAAIAYARRFWDRPCDDGIFWRNDHPIDVAQARKAFHAVARAAARPNGAPRQRGRDLCWRADGQWVATNACSMALAASGAITS